jgi:hypothetical protein
MIVTNMTNIVIVYGRYYPTNRVYEWASQLLSPFLSIKSTDICPPATALV